MKAGSAKTRPKAKAKAKAKAKPNPKADPLLRTALVAVKRTLPVEILDSILAMQFTVAWAGEGRCSPKRLGWWQTDLIDPAGGGDFMARLLPRTHLWASLEAVREAARRVDAKASSRMACPDNMRTLYFLGWEVDEQLRDRLRELKVARIAPAEALPLRLPLTAAFSREQLTAVLGPAVEFTTVPNGRRIGGPLPDSPDVLVQRLAGALVPFAEAYPLPFLETKTDA